MKKSILTQSVIVFIFVFYAISSFGGTRKINLSGLVVDSETYLPVENASFFDSENKLVGTSDQNGYFTLILNTQEKGEMFFSLKIKKNGYENFTQNEHWGDLQGDSNATFYFGLKNKKDSKSDAFSELSLMTDKPSVELMKSDLKRIAEKRDFLNEIETTKSGNDNPYIIVKGKHLLVNESGYIELKSQDNFIKINNENIISASQINGKISRKKIKSMTTLDDAKNTAAIFTR